MTTQITLTDDMKIQVLQQYHPIFTVELWSLEKEELGVTHNNFINLKIIESDIQELLPSQDLVEYQKFVDTDTYSNIIFTDIDDTSVIFPYEYYKGVFYIKLLYWCDEIQMHVVSKRYDCMDNVILFSDEDILQYVNENQSKTIIGTPNMNLDGDIESINTTDNSVVRYLVPLPTNLKEKTSIEINAFYSYGQDFLSSTSHQIGILDTTTRGYTTHSLEYKNQKVLIENNSNLSASTNQVISATRQTDSIYEDESFLYSDPSDSSNTFKLSSNHAPGYTYESIVKYINDNIYIEEYNQGDAQNRVNRIKNNYSVANWTE